MAQNDTVLQNVCKMVNDREAVALAKRRGLGIMSVTWEDNGRTKGSSCGPCISDMTLQVKDSRLPVIRTPNFEDVTWDVPMEAIPLVIGNEKGGNLTTTTLDDYLKNFRNYLHKPSSWSGSNTSLLAPERDSHVIMSAQACFLPIPQGQEAVFNVAVYNYQSTATDPAVLAIVASSRGTSAQVLGQQSEFQTLLQPYNDTITILRQLIAVLPHSDIKKIDTILFSWIDKLYFNDNGKKCPFVGQRLSDHRIETGKTDVPSDAPMSQEEKQQNMLLIIQVPLKKKQPTMRSNSGGMLPPCPKFMSKPGGAPPRRSNVENAVIKVGKSEGPFEEIRNLDIERDPAFPVRVTVQFYKATDNGVMNEDNINEIHEQIESSKKFADHIGSLVVEGKTNRPTEHSWKPATNDTNNQAVHVVQPKASGPVASPRGDKKNNCKIS